MPAASLPTIAAVRRTSLAALCLLLGACFIDFAALSDDSRSVTAKPTLAATTNAVTLAPSTSVRIGLSVEGEAGQTFVLSSPGAAGGLVSASFERGSVQAGESTGVVLSVSPTAQLPGGASTVVLFTIEARAPSDTARTTVSITVVPPFSLSVAGAFTNNPGASLEGTLTIAPAAGFNEAVSLGFTNLPAGWTTSLPASSAPGSVPFSIAVPDSAEAGRYALTLAGTFASSTRNAVIFAQVLERLLPPDIVVSATPDSATVEAGTAAEWLVSVARTAPGIGAVAFSASGLPAGATVTFTPPLVNDTTRARVTTSELTPSGSYPLVFTGAVDSLVRADTVMLVVQPRRTLALTLQPRTIAIAAGGSGQVNLSTQATGAVGPIVLDAPGAPPGFTTTISAGAADSTLDIAVAASVIPGAYVVSARASAGELVARDSVLVTVTAAPQLAIALAPDTLLAEAGGTANLSVSVLSANLSDSIVFDAPSLPAGITAVFLPSGTNRTMRLSIAGSVAAGSYPIVARATAGSLSAVDTATLTVAVASPGFELSLPSTLNMLAGATAIVRVGIAREPGAANLPIQLSANNAPPGGSAWVAPASTQADSALLQINAGQAGTFPVTIMGTGNGLQRSATVLVTAFDEDVPTFSLVPTPTELSLPRGSFTPFTLQVRRYLNHTGAVTFSAETDSPGNYVVEFLPATSSASGNSSVTVRVYASPNITPGPHLLILRGTSGSVVRTALVTLNVF